MLTGKNNEEKIWNYLTSAGLNACGVAGLMGNLYAESGLSPTNLQNSFEKKLGMTDAQYVDAVDNSTYTNFVHDSAGFGLWQLTYWSRKEGFLKYAKSKGKSIGDMETQLEYLLVELKQYGLLSALKTATSVLEASNLILLKFEKPASMNSAATQTKRAGYGQTYYDKYAAGQTAIGGIKMNKKPVSYLQTDARWKNKPYRVKGENSTIGDSGCGPTAAAMLLSTLTGKTITPEDTCKWSVDHGYKALGNGTYYAYFAPQFAAYGIKCWQLNWVNAYHNPKATSFDETVKYLKQGYYAIALMKKGTWTGGGHFVVLWWADDKVRINDPASTKDNRLNGNLATFKNEAAYFWIVDAREYNNSGKLVDGSVAEIKPENVPQAAPGATAERKATGVAKSFDKGLAGTYTVTAGSGLHIRNVAGSKAGSMIVLPHGTKVQNYGYYTLVGNVKWLYIQVTYQGVKYTGFSCGEYLKKQ